jgi:cholesterol oxidase
MLPGTCAMVNPTLTISALAERNIEHIIKNDF